ncbi:hypothetical protein Rhe02_82280 [Rhizocola hellebori]|uniref:Excalibur calcium-binding domain-containing protein n=1 Tax=Rhizocola hellebori TaxID=1392758 RepID=A0A8J3QJ68_9ACTN|nr:excalibur calcium-binding domain-containing protein [Rhizocola hellebori]GIH10161.1 hypothetical protein Rhe02_82280 [Rhizocola hellebori]
MNPLGRVALMCLALVASPAFLAAPAVAAEDATVKLEAKLRFQPTSKSPVLEKLPIGTTLDIACWQKGEPTYGADKYGSMWLFVSTGGWVHSMLVTPVDVDPCGAIIAVPGGFFYNNCDAAQAAGAGQILSTEPGYGPHLDRDRDGVGCEQNDG